MAQVHTKYFKQWIEDQKEKWRQIHEQYPRQPLQEDTTMCNLTEQQIDMLEQTIDEFIDERRMFTGYDVTRATREREGVQLRHREVAGEIHDLEILTDAVQYGDYKKHSISSPQGGPLILYYPEEADPRDYQLSSNVLLGNVKQEGVSNDDDVEVFGPSKSMYAKVDQQSLPPVSASQSGYGTASGTPVSKLWEDHQQKKAPMVFDAADDTEDEDDKPKKGEYTLDYRNRLQVPFIRLMTLKAKSGSTVYLLPDVSEETLTISSKSMDAMKEIQATVDKDGVLVSSKVMRAAGFLGNLYQIQNSTLDDEKVIVVSEKK